MNEPSMYGLEGITQKLKDDRNLKFECDLSQKNQIY